MYLVLLYIGITSSICSPIRVSDRVLMISPELHNHFLPNLEWWCIIMRWSVVQKNCVTIFSVNWIWLFLLSLVNSWSVYNQTLFYSTASEARVSCGKIGLLRSRSKSQQSFKMLVNVCLDDIVWPTKLFVTKLGMPCSIMSQSVMQKNWYSVFKVKVTGRTYIFNIGLFLLYHQKCWSVWNQTWFGSTAS